jgi:tetrahydromethanopterin S-methyltransferase subunit E
MGTGGAGGIAGHAETGGETGKNSGLKTATICSRAGKVLLGSAQVHIVFTHDLVTTWQPFVKQH